jgi:hypothetical protein
MPAVIYDTGALVAAERNKPALWEIHAEALALGVRPIVPVVVLAQAWRGGRNTTCPGCCAAAASFPTPKKPAAPPELPAPPPAHPT